MTTVDDYIATLGMPDRALFEQMTATVKKAVSSVEQGVSYALPAFFYKGKALVSFVVRKKHYSLYPYSGKVIDRLKAELAGFETTPGSVHFSSDRPIGDALLMALIEARMKEIDDGSRG